MKNLLTLCVSCLLLLGVTVANAGVVVIVSADSSVDYLEKADVSDIFLAKKSSFPGGASAVPVDQTENSSDREAFHELVTGMSGRQLQSYWSRLVFSGKGEPPKEVEGAEVVSLVAGDPSLIGYVDASLVDDSVKVVLTP